jgi:hypothetical protein
MTWILEHWIEVTSVIGVVAFFLSVPMSVLANLLTPRVQNWWALRSKNAARKRIASLERNLWRISQYHEHPVLLTNHLLFIILRCMLVGTIPTIWAIINMITIRIATTQQMGDDIIKSLVEPAALVLLMDACVAGVVVICGVWIVDCVLDYYFVSRFRAFELDTEAEITKLRGRIGDEEG